MIIIQKSIKCSIPSFACRYISPSDVQLASRMALKRLLFCAAVGIATSLDSTFSSPASVAPCLTFAQSHLKSFDAIFVNATSYAARSRSVGRISNQYAFCEVSAIINYPMNNELHFTLWLPERSQYGGSFVAVGEY
jgi:hypothetical protein